MARRGLHAVLVAVLTLFGVACGPVADGGGGRDRGPDPSRLAMAPDNDGLTLPPGFGVVVVAEGVGVARHLVVDDEGDVYVRLRQSGEEGGIAALRDTDGDGRADVVEKFAQGSVGTGIGLHEGHLYWSSQSEVFRVRLEAGELLPRAEPETVISDFPSQGQHAAKSFAFDDSGHIYVNVGGPSNACQSEARTPGSPGLDPCPQLERQAGVWRFDADRSGQTQVGDGYRFVTGTRNLVAIAWNPLVGQLYAAMHGRDQLDYLFPETFTAEQRVELPAEELLMLDDGDDFGWPYCYYDHIQGKKVLAPEYGGDGDEVGRCAEVGDPIVAFPGHWGPNAMVFYSGEHFPERYRGGAFIAFHGSWNRSPQPQAGYNVVFVPFDGAEPAGEWQVFADGFARVATIGSPGEARHRPSGVAQGPDGSLYVSEDTRGRIWRIVYVGEG